MKVAYSFPNVPALARHRLEIENRGEQLHYQLEGPWSFFFPQLVRFYVRWFNRHPPISTSDQGNLYSLYVPPIPSPAHARHFEGLVRNHLYRGRVPLAVTIAVTSRCQLACEHCSAAGSRSAAGDLTTEELKRVVRESIDLGVTNITFTGGEPLLRDDLEDLLAAVPPEQAVALVFTNALSLTAGRAASLKAAGALAVQISLDSPLPDEHDRLRHHAGTFAAVEQGVRHAREAGLMVGLSSYATNRSVSSRQLTALTELAARWGVHEITLFDLIPTGRLIRLREVTLTKRSRRALLREGAALNRRFRGRPQVITQTWTNHGSGLARLIGCLAGHLQFHIAPGGGFTPCDFTPLSFGNVRDESLATLWNRIVTHPAFRRRCRMCRMQNPAFRKQFIETIPESAPLPYPIGALDASRLGK